MLKELRYLDAEQIEKIEKIAKMTLSQEGELLEMCPKTAQWVRDCYNKPSFSNMKLNAVCELGGWSGVMVLKKGDVWYEVMNAGDTYAATLAFDMRKREWMVTTWGDLIEKAEIEEGVVLDTF